MAGEINSTDVHLRMKIGTVWVFLGGQKAHTETINNTPIDITNKGSNSFRELLDAEGLRSNDISAEFVFTSDEAFEALNIAAQLKQIKEFQIFRGTQMTELFMKVASVARTAPDGEAVTATVSLVSTGLLSPDLPIVPLPPTANFTFVPTLLSVAFTDTSTDNVLVTGWFWDFGDDNNDNVKNPVHVFAAGGKYQVTLTVTDIDENIDTIIKEVTVAP